MEGRREDLAILLIAPVPPHRCFTRQEHESTHLRKVIVETVAQAVSMYRMMSKFQKIVLIDTQLHGAAPTELLLLQISLTGVT